MDGIDNEKVPGGYGVSTGRNEVVMLYALTLERGEY